MEQFIAILLALGFKQVQNVGDYLRYMLYIKKFGKQIAYFSVFVVQNEGDHVGGITDNTPVEEYYKWELQLWQLEPRKQIMYLPEFEFSIDTRGTFFETDLFKETVEGSIRYLDNIDFHIKNLERKVNELRAQKHMLKASDYEDISDNYQENLEIGWELGDLHDDIELLKDLKDQK